jgi:hypothetical protein
MWRKFLWYGIPMVVIRGIVLVVNVVRQLEGFVAGSHPPAVLLVAAGVITAAGALLVNAGLIGAAVGTGPRTRVPGGGEDRRHSS